jgi:hypothetical protein
MRDFLSKRDHALRNSGSGEMKKSLGISASCKPSESICPDLVDVEEAADAESEVHVNGSASDGPVDGTSNGLVDGTSDRLLDGTSDGLVGGTSDGLVDGTSDGLLDGTIGTQYFDRNIRRVF